jgi:hypothetical protein
MRMTNPFRVDWLEQKKPENYYVGAEWVFQPHSPIVESFQPSAPGNRYWYGCLLGALGSQQIRERCSILDYGCGNAPLGNFLSGFLNEFTYYGLEPQGSPHIERSPKDPRIMVGFVGSSVEQLAVANANCAVLGSVFTHLEWSDSVKILDSLIPIANRGAIVFTCFFSESEKLIGDEHYSYASVRTYHYSLIVEDMVSNYAKARGLRYEISDVFYSLGVRHDAGQALVHRFVKLYS